MGVGADDTFPGGHQALFGEEGVLHPHLAHVVEVVNVKPLGKGAALQALLGGLDVLVGGEVVHDQGDLALVKDPGEPLLVKLPDGHGRGDVVAQDNIKVRLDQLSRLDVLLAAVGSQDFLCHSHSHGYCASVLCDEVQGSPPLFTGY